MKKITLTSSLKVTDKEFILLWKMITEMTKSKMSYRQKQTGENIGQILRGKKLSLLKKRIKPKLEKVKGKRKKVLSKFHNFLTTFTTLEI